MKDLHIHTIYSDGELNEVEILDKILNKKILEFSITDHDTIEGSKKVREELEKNPQKYGHLIFHPGIELSCRLNEYSNGINMHLLVYNFEYNNVELLKLIEEVSNLRKKKISRMLNLVKEKYGVEIENKRVEEVLRVTKSFGKPHVFTLLTEHGKYDRDEFFKFMDNLKTDDLKLDAKTVIENLKNASEIYLAHPIEIMEEYNLGAGELEKLVEHLKDLGISGVETKHSSHTKQMQQKFSDICEKYNLKQSVGSDFHGENIKPGLHIGDIEKF